MPISHKMPKGTVTFLFTDIEGSTRMWESQPRAMQAALARHDTLLREAIESNGGYVFKTVGDAFCAAFPTAPQALDAALPDVGAPPGGQVREQGLDRARGDVHVGVDEPDVRPARRTHTARCRHLARHSSDRRTGPRSPSSLLID